MYNDKLSNRERKGYSSTKAVEGFKRSISQRSLGTLHVSFITFDRVILSLIRFPKARAVIWRIKPFVLLLHYLSFVWWLEVGRSCICDPNTETQNSYTPSRGETREE